MKMIFNLLTFLALLFSTAAFKTFTRVQLFGSLTNGFYYFQLYVGNPPQKQIFMADTGSSLLVMKCGDKCKDCGQSTLANYNPALSTTNQPLLCNSTQQKCSNSCSNKNQMQSMNNICLYFMKYTNYASVSAGTMKADILRFDNDSGEKDDGFRATFGCANSFTLNDNILINGIFGLGLQKMNPIFNWFEHDGRSVQKVLAVCLGKEEGYFQLGINQNSRQTKQKAVSYFDGEYYANLKDIKSISLGQQVLYNNQSSSTKYSVILDTGTTWTSLPEDQYRKVVNIYKSICDNNVLSCEKKEEITNFCFTLIQTDARFTINQYLDKIFPSFNLQFNNISISVKPSQYLYQKVGKYGGLFCLMFHHEIFEQKQYIIGIDMLRNNKIIYHFDQKFVQIIPNADCSFQSSSKYAYDRGSISLTSLIVSYSLLVFALIVTTCGPKLFRTLIKIKKRFIKKQLQFVEEAY